MRIKEIKLYKFDELEDDAKEKARDWYREMSAEDSYPLDEMIDSLKALFKAAGIKLTNWSLGAYNQNNYVRFDLGDSENLTGKRALAWLENRLFNDLRITRAEYLKNRKAYLGYGDGYRIGKIQPCPLTGICYDEDFLDALKKAVKNGDTLKDAFNSLADKCASMIEAELDYRNKDEQVEESINANEYEFTEDGRRA